MPAAPWLARPKPETLTWPPWELEAVGLELGRFRRWKAPYPPGQRRWVPVN